MDKAAVTPMVKYQMSSLIVGKGERKVLKKEDVLRCICRGALDFVYPDGPIHEECIKNGFPGDADQVPNICKELCDDGYIYMTTEPVSESWPDVTGWKLTEKGFCTDVFAQALSEAAVEYADMVGRSVEETKSLIRPNRLKAVLNG